MADRDALAERWLGRMPALASFALVVVIGLLLGHHAWRVIPGGDGGAVYSGPVTAAVTPTNRPDTDTVRRAGLSVPLFGEPPKQAPAPVSKPVETAPVTQLDLKLRGVAASDDPAEALAIIEGPDGESLPYRIGDALPGDAELVAIEVDRVLLRRGGSEETLLFSDEKATARTAPTRTSPGLARVPAARTPSAAENAQVQLKPDSSARLRQYLAVIPNDLSKVTELVRALPVMQNGVLQGFRLFPGRQRDLFSEVGLRRGDIVTQVNGMPLNDPARGLELVNQLGSASQVTLEIIRRGRAQTLNVQL